MKGKGRDRGNLRRAKIINLVIMIFFSVTLPAGARAVHDVTGKVSCLACHVRLPFNNHALSFNSETETECVKCHLSHHGTSARFSHPVQTVPSMAVPKDMPLDSNGRMTCITCHTFHEGYKDEEGNKKFFLRRTAGKTFCYTCHKKPLF